MADDIHWNTQRRGSLVEVLEPLSRAITTEWSSSDKKLKYPKTSCSTKSHEIWLLFISNGIHPGQSDLKALKYKNFGIRVHHHDIFLQTYIFIYM